MARHARSDGIVVRSRSVGGERNAAQLDGVPVRFRRWSDMPSLYGLLPYKLRLVIPRKLRNHLLICYFDTTRESV